MEKTWFEMTTEERAITPIKTWYDRQPQMLSVCCGEPAIHPDMDICKGCGEHTDFESEDEYDNEMTAGSMDRF